MKQQLLHRVFAPLMALLLFCSSVGMNSYARWCNCKSELTVSLLTESEGDCCKHQKQKSQASCCHAPQQEQQHCEQHNNKNCCDTEVVYEVLDVEAPLLSADTEEAPSMDDFSPTLTLPNISIVHSYSEYIHLQFFHSQISDTGPPLPRSGRAILQQIQVLRC